MTAFASRNFDYIIPVKNLGPVQAIPISLNLTLTSSQKHQLLFFLNNNNNSNNNNNNKIQKYISKVTMVKTK